MCGRLHLGIYSAVISMIPNNNQYSISNDISGVTSVVSELDKVCAYLEEMGQH